MSENPPNVATVLYVDDEELACKYFARAIEPDYKVLTAPGVSEALAILRQPDCKVEVLVTDYRMPGQAGGELLRVVEQHYPHLVRILVTAYADKEVLLETVNGGDIFRILEKPLDMGALRSALRLASASARERAARRHSMLAIEETVAFLAHELNTPLSTIANFARTLQRRVNSDEPERGLPLKAEIGNAAAHMTDNARYCLSVLSSFVESVKRACVVPPARLAEGSAAQMISAILNSYPLTPPQRAAVAVDVRQDFTVRASPNCVALVLSSVLSNALRALEGHPAPSLRFVVAHEGRPYISLEDNGPGIPPAILNRLLIDPVTMHGRSGGSGWGLIFCNRVMQSFGGHLRVQSEQGQWTTVTLNFPASEKEPA
ncbi:hybrid sensor histidine kinase/response regulator [Massilia endophytica]|uniref:hybrid sensor histidine kinase/response regulator n=1 Tax=Massilia endophytica TaxID=2899220 RepID=UPI001E2A66C6|nr:hybrid sensor histidine kinase/response regulator [Massilia endophytica]UGQ48648.1 hybrid sensor histidine kinase/response regulator [Massilia endophytica]